MYNQKVKFKYDCTKFVDCKYPDESSCIKHQVHELTDIHEKFRKHIWAILKYIKERGTRQINFENGNQCTWMQLQ